MAYYPQYGQDHIQRMRNDQAQRQQLQALQQSQPQQNQWTYADKVAADQQRTNDMLQDIHQRSADSWRRNAPALGLMAGVLAYDHIKRGHVPAQARQGAARTQLTPNWVLVALAVIVLLLLVIAL